MGECRLHLGGSGEGKMADSCKKYYKLYQKSSRCVVNSKKIEPISVQKQLNSIYYTEIHVSNYFKSSSVFRQILI